MFATINYISRRKMFPVILVTASASSLSSRLITSGFCYSYRLSFLQIFCLFPFLLLSKCQLSGTFRRHLMQCLKFIPKPCFTVPFVTKSWNHFLLQNVISFHLLPNKFLRSETLHRNQSSVYLLANRSSKKITIFSYCIFGTELDC